MKPAILYLATALICLGASVQAQQKATKAELAHVDSIRMRLLPNKFTDAMPMYTDSGLRFGALPLAVMPQTLWSVDMNGVIHVHKSQLAWINDSTLIVKPYKRKIK